MSQVPELFSSIPAADHLSLFGQDGRPKGTEISDFLSLRAKDVAKATRLAPTAIRYDLRMPELLEKWLRDVATTMSLVAEFFGGDAQRTSLWFATPNPQLGSLAPVDMIKMGRVRKLLTFVQVALDQNKR